MVLYLSLDSLGWAHRQLGSLEGSVVLALEAKLCACACVRVQDKHRRSGALSLVSKCTWCFHPPVVVWIDAHFFLVPREGEFAAVERLQLVVALQIRPSPDAAVDDMWQAFPV